MKTLMIATVMSVTFAVVTMAEQPVNKPSQGNKNKKADAQIQEKEATKLSAETPKEAAKFQKQQAHTKAPQQSDTPAIMVAMQEKEKVQALTQEQMENVRGEGQWDDIKKRWRDGWNAKFNKNDPYYRDSIGSPVSGQNDGKIKRDRRYYPR